jgi:NADH dehydrogenase
MPINGDDATDIRRRILLAFEEAEDAAHAEDRVPMLTFVVVGGGPTGVELAGAIAELARKALVADFRKIQPHHARVLLIEAGPRLLPAFPERLSAAAKRALERLGAEVRLGEP